jgi:hypothetical protein
MDPSRTIDTIVGNPDTVNKPFRIFSTLFTYHRNPQMSGTCAFGGYYRNSKGGLSDRCSWKKEIIPPASDGLTLPSASISVTSTDHLCAHHKY